MRCMGHHLGDLEDTKSKKYYKLSLLWCWWSGFWAVSSRAGIRTRGCDPASPTPTSVAVIFCFWVSDWFNCLTESTLEVRQKSVCRW